MATIMTLWMTFTMIRNGYQPTVFLKYHPESKQIELRLDSQMSPERDSEVGQALVQLGNQMVAH